MPLRKVKLIILLVSFALLSLIIIQFFWAISSMKLSEKSFNSKAIEAMRKTSEKMNQNYIGFELFSKIKTHSKEGIYVVRQKWDNDKFLINSPEDKDTVPLFCEHANEHLPFVYKNIMFSYPMDIEIVAKFRYLLDDTLNLQMASIGEINPQNFREKFSDKDPVIARYDTLALDSILQNELASYAISDRYHFGYIHEGSQRLEYFSAGADPKKLEQSTLHAQLTNDKYFSVPYQLVIYFENYPGFLLRSMQTQLLISFMIIVILLLCFYLFVKIIYRQRKLSEMKDDFVNNMTHEFKTPLANISAALETISNKSIDQKNTYLRIYKIVGQETERLRENIEKVLQVARFENDEILLSFDKIDLHEIIQTAISGFEHLIKKSNALIDYELKAKPSIIVGDETHLVNVVCNLIDNAIKYSSSQVSIKINTENFKEGIVFRIKDTGRGIPKDLQKKIFNKFYRISEGDIHTIKGFGLGLTYVKAIIESHNGEIKVNSQINSGTEFEIYLPSNQKT